MSANDPKRTLAPTWYVGCPGTATPRELTDPGLWRGDDERILDDLRMQLGLDVNLAAEYEIEELFDDCVLGAIPPVGECYGLDTVVDDSIEEQPEVYLEGGDHATLVHMTHAQFASLTATARHGSFSVHA